LVVLVLGLGVFSVHRLLAAVPAGPPVPDLPLATPGVTVPADGSSAPGPGQAPTSSAMDSTKAGTTAVETTGVPEVDEVVVSVVGLVGRSGLVTVTPGARVADALDRAGGVLDGGDRDGLNLARKVVDGEQILVGLAPGPDGPRGPRSGIVGADDAPVDGGPAPGAEAGPGGMAPGPGGMAPGPDGMAQSGGLVDLNSADATVLESLPGVGPVTASSILAWRAANGAFTSIDQLAEVDGIGPVTLARLRPLVTV
jgi:competence protein ComEA